MAASQAARKVEKSKIGEEEETEDSEPRALNVPKPLTGHYGPKCVSTVVYSAVSV